MKVAWIYILITSRFTNPEIDSLPGISGTILSSGLREGKPVHILMEASYDLSCL